MKAINLVSITIIIIVLIVVLAVWSDFQVTNTENWSSLCPQPSGLKEQFELWSLKVWCSELAGCLQCFVGQMWRSRAIVCIVISRAIHDHKILTKCPQLKLILWDFDQMCNLWSCGCSNVPWLPVCASLKVVFIELATVDLDLRLFSQLLPLSIYIIINAQILSKLKPLIQWLSLHLPLGKNSEHLLSLDSELAVINI